MSPSEKSATVKASPSLRPRERRLALMAAVVIGCWLVVSWLVQPLWDRTHTLHARVEAQTKKLDALTRLMTQATDIEQQYQQIAGYLTSEDDERAQSSFLNELERLSRDSSVQLNFKPRSLKREERVSRFEVELDVEGPQDRLFAFLDALLAMPNLIEIERLRIASVPGKEQALRANLVVQKLILH